MTTKHTPTPWTAEITNSHPTGRILKHDIVIAYGTSRSDTLFIVQACNAEDGLQEVAATALCALMTTPRLRLNGTDTHAIAFLLLDALGIPKTNPYPKRQGFGLRFARAKAALQRFGRDYFDAPYSRDFDDCFENGDGDAVVWALIHDAIRDLAKGDTDLQRGIQNMGEKVWAQWFATYNSAPEPPAPLADSQTTLPARPAHASTHVLMSNADLAILERNLGPSHAITARVRDSLAEISDPTLAKYREAAQRQSRDGELEVDPCAVVSKGEDEGAYIMAWLWISDDEAGVTVPRAPNALGQGR